MERYGTFSKDRKEFIITKPDTPAPWVNYLSNGRYNGLISHTGGGYSFYESPRDSRITRWRYNSMPMDRPGRYILLRNAETGNYWSPTWQPTETELERYECRHGMYYTRIDSQFAGIEHRMLYFIPPEDDLEIWKLTLINHNRSPVVLDIFAFAELALGHALVDLINQPNDQHFNEVFFDKNDETLFASKRYWVRYSGPTVEQANEAWDKVVCFACSEKVKGWDGSKEAFIGRWRSERNPINVERGKCSNSEITAGDAVAALQTEVRLQPSEEKSIAFLMGIVPRNAYRQNARTLLQKYRNLNTVDGAFQNLRAEWDDYLDHVQVRTPDDDMNTMLNVWNQYQSSVTFKFSRDASYHHGGLLFGRGYRDACQDLMGPVIARPAWVRKRIQEMAQYQFSDGSTFHLYHPLSRTGERTGHSDTPLWLPLAVTVYLKETGDFDFLEKKRPFYDEDSGTIYEHMRRAVSFTLSNLTERSLAKFGPGDWNDTLDYLGRKGRGESVWVTMFLAYILKEMKHLSAFLKKNEDEAYYRHAYERIATAINQHGWDGAWYIRGTSDEGDVIGSDQNEQGKLFLNTQSWAVISGVADNGRGEQCMASVKQHLETDKGPKILHPPYTRIDDRIGLATRCVPGKKENGAVFNHPVSWAILAECLLGHGDRAFQIYKKALPMNPVIDIDRYEVEPYVYAEYVTSPDHKTYGQASHSWLTGSSAWMLRDGIDYILGIRPDYRGLVIDPCVPSEWSSFEVKRVFRGKTYHIDVSNPNKVQKGVKEMRVENQPIACGMIDLNHPDMQHLLKDKTAVHVRVIMG